MTDWFAADLAKRVTVPVHSGLDAGAPLSVIAFATWTPVEITALGERAAAAGIRIIPLRHDGALTLLGPVVGAGLPGCLGCAEDARLRALALPGDPERTTFGGPPVPTRLPALAALVAMIADDPAAAAETLWVLSDASVSTHHLVPRAGCLVCRPLPEDSPEAARFDPVSRPVDGELRRPNPAAAGDRLKQVLFDHRLGPVVRLGRAEDLPLPLVSAATVVNGEHEWGYGRGATVAQAERTALFEAVERRLGMVPHARRTVLRASYRELGPDVALDPARLGLPDPGSGSGLTPFHPDIATRWVHGWSMTGQRALAVPEHVAYYGVPADPDAPRFVYETSNGCGLGNSLEEAVLYGLFEVAERDAFLMAWYAATPLRRIAIPDGSATAHLADQLGERGYDLLLFDATNDMGVPVVLSLALHRDVRSTAPQAYFSAGAHVDPRIALHAAALEAAVGIVAHTANLARDPDRAHLLRMLADPGEVHDIDDHVALYTLAEARPRYEFLLGADPVDWRELWPEPPAPTDLTRVLTELTTRLGCLGLDTIVVDQTDAWTRDRLGLHAAKVIVPGTLPMTFGHSHRRTLDLPRLLEVPFRLGRAPAVLNHADLALHPHPFP